MTNGFIATNRGQMAYAPGIKARAGVQNRRISNGVKSGQIGPVEQRVLSAQRNSISGQLSRSKADDGVLDFGERVAIHRRANNASDTINAFRNNGQSRQGGASPLGEKESFTSSIIGDPHFAMNGTVNGEAVDTKFDNHDLGDRTQIAGAGFKLDTETVPWGDNGAAVVGSASVTTGFGRGQKEVTVNSDGSVLVGDQQVSLEAGETKQLNRTSTLSVDENGSYTVSSRNGKVVNTFDVNEHDKGNYININTAVDDVQTVGWFQNQA